MNSKTFSSSSPLLRLRSPRQAPQAQPALSPQPSSESRIEPHVKRVAIVVILGAIMSVLDTTIVNVALHDLSTDLHASFGGIQWVITGYLLSLAAVIPVTGWAVRRYSARRLYLIALRLHPGSARARWPRTPVN